MMDKRLQLGCKALIITADDPACSWEKRWTGLIGTLVGWQPGDCWDMDSPELKERLLPGEEGPLLVKIPSRVLIRIDDPSVTISSEMESVC